GQDGYARGDFARRVLMTANLGNKGTGPFYFFMVNLVHSDVRASTDPLFLLPPSSRTGIDWAAWSEHQCPAASVVTKLEWPAMRVAPALPTFTSCIGGGWPGEFPSCTRRPTLFTLSPLPIVRGLVIFAAGHPVLVQLRPSNKRFLYELSL